MDNLTEAYLETLEVIDIQTQVINQQKEIIKKLILENLEKENMLKVESAYNCGS